MSGYKRHPFYCANCGRGLDFFVPDRASMRETAQTKYADDPMTIPGCALCAPLLGAVPAMFPLPFASDGRMSAVALEIKARWSEWLSAGSPPGREPFRIQLVRPTLAHM